VSQSQREGANRKLLVRLLGVAVAMFMFGVFATPPLYEKFCEITGLGQAGVKIEDVAPGPSGSERTVRIRFDATTNSALKWTFHPVQPSMDVTLGEASTAQYYAANDSNHGVIGRAVFNVSPPEAARYFVKTECFCFTEQELDAGQGREMPVYFYIKEDLPESITEMTLAYTFFKQEDVPDMAHADHDH
jgi:cytochrome c oxidase assembly protein subunit 11